MSRYIAVIEFDETEQVFGAYFPDAPGCTAMGATEQDVVDNAIDALSEWISDVIAEGHGIPQPRTYMQLREAGELGRDHMIATLPLLRESGKVVRANISMDAGLLESIDETAGRIGLTRSAFLASAARDKIKQSG
jgi:predicted RNase H-like HicB family nuclease